jgi:thioredoxin reductase
MENTSEYEVIVIGGSYAGLSAAMTLGRALRHVLVIDSGLPCNRQAPAAHNFIAHDGQKPALIAAQAREQVKRYPTVQFLEDLVIEVTGENNAFTVITTGGKRFGCKKILFATGIKDQMPEIEGFADCWGISVLHCPYCHGYEVKNKPTAVMANGEEAFHTCMVLTQWTRDITLFTSGDATLDAGQSEKLSTHGVVMVETGIKSIVHKNGSMKKIALVNGEEHDFEVMYAKIPFVQHCQIPVRLGCAAKENGLLVHDEFKKTCVPGVYAAGDNTSLSRSIATSVAAGNVAGMGINGELTSDIF